MDLSTMAADLAALAAADVPFDWVIEDFDDRDRIIADTHAQASQQIAELRARCAGSLPRSGVTFHTANDEVWACVDVRPAARRTGDVTQP